MIDFMGLSNSVNTASIAKTSALKIKGKNVRYTRLKKNSVYLMRVRNTRHQHNYDNPYTLVRFVGTSHEDVNKNMDRLSEFESTGIDFYFEAVECVYAEIYQFTAYKFKNALCIGSAATGVSFYEIKT